MIQDLSVERLRPNPGNMQNNALNEKMRVKWIAKATRILDSFAERIERVDTNHKYVGSFYPSRDDQIYVPNDAGSKKYVYTASEYGLFVLYRETAGEQAESELVKQRLRARHNALQEISERAYYLRREFVRAFPSSLSDIQVTAIHLTSFMRTSFISIDPVEVSDLLGLPKTDDVDELIEQLLSKAREYPQRYLLVAIYSAMDSVRHNYFNWKGEHRPNNELDAVYSFLEALGYEMSDEERAIQNGTHELFRQGVS